MANAGRHADTHILKKMIFESKVLKIKVEDSPVIKRIKNIFNQLVLIDEAYNCKYNGHKFVNHSSWKYVNRTAIKVNQLRFKYWQFTPLSEKDLTKDVTLI